MKIFVSCNIYNIFYLVIFHRSVHAGLSYQIFITELSWPKEFTIRISLQYLWKIWKEISFLKNIFIVFFKSLFWQIKSTQNMSVGRWTEYKHSLVSVIHQTKTNLTALLTHR